ncbi:MAG TPA: LacI family DNA-binding transcriptional regulator [Ktedonobacteraceae bacterium]|jgi:LacI family transcriptional regulator|nr:LacI family DNA-binding transcriptional regulator [Ktedonobacteraceae bacterium]
MKNKISPLPLAARHVSQREIAKHAGVSTSTVSRVLNNVDGISDELRGHVLKVAMELGYHNAAASGELRQLHLFTTSFAAMTASHTFHPSILDGVATACRQKGILLSYSVIEQSAADRTAVLSQVRDRPETGILLMSIDDRVLIEELLALKVPIALINADHRDLPIDTFLPDNFISGLLATRHLVELGHRHILHMTELANKQRSTLQRRLNGYSAALEEASIPYDPALVLESPLRVDDAHQAMRVWLATHRLPFSAVFCANDASAIGVMRALQEVGKRVPEDVSVIGYDDVPAAALLTPSLTTFHIDCEEIGQLAVQRMLYRALKPGATPIRVEIASRLVVRQSVAAYHGDAGRSC